jgi:RNA-directed DNA polymerase
VRLEWTGIGPLWANVFLDDVDRMLERAQSSTQQGIYEVVRYTRFADDLLVLVSSHPSASHWAPMVERRLREELGKLDLTINEEKSRIVDFGAGESFDFLGYTFRWTDSEKTPGKKVVLARPRKKKRTEFLQALKVTMCKRLHWPIVRVVQRIVNPRVRGWVNYASQADSARNEEAAAPGPRGA